MDAPRPSEPKARSPLRQRLIDAVGDDEQLVFLEGPEFDAAIVGLCERFGMPSVICYDYDKVIRVLRRQGMSYEDAVEWYGFNIIGAWLGDETPVFLSKVKS